MWQWEAVIDVPECPACGQKSWEPLGSLTFARVPVSSSAYRALRLRVLFEIWRPETDHFEAKQVLCDCCGFVCYLPRATAAEVDAKYKFIAEQTSSEPRRASPTRLDEERSQDIYDFVAPQRELRSVLDFGGGNGALLNSFVRAGFDCGVVDYVTATVPRVVRLGQGLEDLEPGAKFGVIVCSHVFEHLADPVSVARKLGAHLGPEGILFVEVPLEILGGPPKMREPVTHVNFFCESSLRTMLIRAGYDVTYCTTVLGRTENDTVRYAVRALARRAQRPVDVPSGLCPGGSDEARRLLGAGVLARFGRAVGQPPRRLLKVVFHKARRRPRPEARHV